MRRKGMKKVLALTLAGSMMLGMAACGKSEDGTGTAAGTEATTAQATETGTDTEVATEADTEPVTEEKKDLNVKPGDVIVHMDFEDGKTGNFTQYTKGGKFEMENVNGQLVLHIESCGSVDYANQIFFDGYQLLQGAEYTFSFDVSSTIERTIEYRSGQINGSDYHAYQGEYIQIGPEMKTITVDFFMEEESDPAPRMVFNMGKQTDMTEDPGPHDIIIDNISLVVKDVTNAQVLEGLPDYPKVNINQLGYLVDDPKTVVVKTKDATDFKVVDVSSGNTVYEGKLSNYAFHAAYDTLVRQGDFSEVKTPGTYKVVTEEGESYEFVIGEGLYDDLYAATVRMLFMQRCGMELTTADAGAFAHPACHVTEAIVYDDQGLKRDVSGGWHDAGDYGRYVVAGAKAVQDLMLAYEDYGVKADDMNIPESGNGVPDILDEARYELDWMLKMQEKSNGGVYHKVTCLNFPETVMPEEETAELYLAPISVAATGDFAAVMAKASQVYAPFDQAFADTCLAAAKDAWGYIRSLDGVYYGYKNPEEIVTGEYPDAVVADEIFWAAAELYLAGYSEIAADLEGCLAAVGVGSELGWADITGYAYYDLLRQSPEGIDAVMDDVKARFYNRVGQLEEREDTYGLMLYADFPWGSNMTIANHGMLMRMAYNLTGDEHYKSLAKRQLDYLLGENPLGMCFVTGFGVMTPKHPHHRPSEVKGEAIPGMLVGGADSAHEDSYAKAVLFDQAPALSYADNAQSYSTNEITIYWNSPLVYLLAACK
ncbi:MAG: glycoside hydrolase family 9 protein [Eubacterium sp.]|nr:glycoside hydrolase family 9 protein [Eubacterium sp.]